MDSADCQNLSCGQSKYEQNLKVLLGHLRLPTSGRMSALPTSSYFRHQHLYEAHDVIEQRFRKSKSCAPKRIKPGVARSMVRYGDLINAVRRASTFHHWRTRHTPYNTSIGLVTGLTHPKTAPESLNGITACCRRRTQGVNSVTVIQHKPMIGQFRYKRLIA